MGGPEVGVASRKAGDDLLDGKPLPRGAEFGMSQQGAPVGQAHEGVEEAAVADVDFGRLGLAFAEVFEPRRKLAHKERPGERVEVGAGRLIAHA